MPKGYNKQDMKIGTAYGGNRVDYTQAYRIVTENRDQHGFPLIFQYLHFRGSNLKDNSAVKGEYIMRLVNYIKDREQEAPVYENGKIVDTTTVKPQHALIISTPASHRILSHVYRVFAYYPDNLPGYISIGPAGNHVLIIDDKIYDFDPEKYENPITEFLFGFTNERKKMKIIPEKHQDGLNLAGLSIDDYLKGDSIEAHIQEEIGANYDRFIKAHFAWKEFRLLPAPAPDASFITQEVYKEKMSELELKYNEAYRALKLPISIPEEDFPTVKTTVKKQKVVDLRNRKKKSEKN